MNLHISYQITDGLIRFQSYKTDQDNNIIDNQVYYCPVGLVALKNYAGNLSSIMFNGYEYVSPDDCSDIIINGQSGFSLYEVTEKIAEKIGYPV